jgi:hypothetical protein
MKRQMSSMPDICGLVAGILAAATFVAPAGAYADPANCAGLHDVRLCDLSKTYYCPSLGTLVPALTTCPEYVVGPHRAGMLPDDVTPDRGDR